MVAVDCSDHRAGACFQLDLDTVSTGTIHFPHYSGNGEHYFQPKPGTGADLDLATVGDDLL